MSQNGNGDGNWGRWGPEDERGALNLIDGDRVLEATRRLRTGKVYSLAIPISHHATPTISDRPLPERLTLSTPVDSAVFETYGAEPGVGANEDVIFIPSHAGTHMDALSHVYADGTIYNGHPAGSFTPKNGAAKCGDREDRELRRPGRHARRGRLGGRGAPRGWAGGGGGRAGGLPLGPGHRGPAG